MSLPRFRCSLTVFISCSFLILVSPTQAQTEIDIRAGMDAAERFEKQANWEQAREIYEKLLGRPDHGLNIRERYQRLMCRCWQSRRHQDLSYRKEVLSIEFGQALRLYNIIGSTLLDGAVEKKKVDPSKLFRKGLEELDAALGDPSFLHHHLPHAKPDDLQIFRELLRKTWGDTGNLSRKEAAKLVGEVAMAAELHLQLNATVVAMEFACGACYAIDEFTVYLTPNQLRVLMQSLSQSEAVGVGLKLAAFENKVVIRDIVIGSQAELLVPPISRNEQIVSVDKKPVIDLSLQTVTAMLEGAVGTFVEIELVSPKDMSVRTVRLERRLLAASVYSGMLDNTSIGYVKISSFTETTVQEVDNALAFLSGPEIKIKGLVLDLRDNSGGVFESAIETVRRFLSKGRITSIIHQDSKFNVIYYAKNPDALTIPMVVLVNGDTASAAEVLAGALKDNKRAVLIGQTTFGKGCTQYVLKLPNALGGVPTGGMKLTVARFYSPNGVPYSGRGIVPHILIDDRMAQSEAAATMMGGPFLSRAIDELNRLIAAPK